MVALVLQHQPVIFDDILDAVLPTERLNDNDIEFTIQRILS